MFFLGSVKFRHLLRCCIRLIKYDGWTFWVISLHQFTRTFFDFRSNCAKSNFFTPKYSCKLVSIWLLPIPKDVYISRFAVCRPVSIISRTTLVFSRTTVVLGGPSRYSLLWLTQSCLNSANQSSTMGLGRCFITEGGINPIDTLLLS